MPTQQQRLQQSTKSADFSGCDKTPLPERRRRWIRLADAPSPCAPSPVAKRYEYGMWGEATQTVGTLSADFGYAGYYVHGLSGLNLTTFRAYSPSLGRWINRDPIGERGGVTLYGYVDNSPVDYLDPSGLLQSDPFEGTAFSEGTGVTGFLWPPSIPPGEVPSPLHDIIPLPTPTPPVRKNRCPPRKCPPPSSPPSPPRKWADPSFRQFNAWEEWYRAGCNGPMPSAPPPVPPK
jgi:RHS repeat-associated protein